MAGVAAPDDLDAQLRRVDPDRWLTSRFIADAGARADVVTLYAFDHELARARRVATTPLLAEIRLTWWREALDEIFAGGPPRRHPLAEALAAVVHRRGLTRASLETMIDGQIAVADAGVLDAVAAEAWADAVQGSLAAAAASILDPRTAADDARPAGHAWGLALLLRVGLVSPDIGRPLLQGALAEARAAARRLSVAALPAALPARLARFDLGAKPAGQLSRRLSLVVASASGRL